MLLLALACAQPLDLPQDPAETGVPVGVTTVQAQGQIFEIWYPAADGAGDPEAADILQFIPAEIRDMTGLETLPEQTSGVRDAPLRNTGELLPVVVFSHGFGGYRLQSLDYTVHLASRGYLVIALDHPGRRMQDLLPCMFSPALDGCEVDFDDPGPADVRALMSWLEANADAWDADLDRVALSGHSAGGGTTATLGQDDERFVALLPMASAQSVERDVPTLLLAGDCDSFAVPETLRAQGEDLLLITDAGHLPFSDFCDLELGAYADSLVGREDINDTMLEQLYGLAVDGCPGYTPPDDLCAEYGDLADAKRITRHVATRFLDAHLRDQGPGVGADFDEVEWVPAD